jgi:hypothetical protein
MTSISRCHALYHHCTRPPLLLLPNSPCPAFHPQKHLRQPLLLQLPHSGQRCYVNAYNPPLPPPKVSRHAVSACNPRSASPGGGQELPCMAHCQRLSLFSLLHNRHHPNGNRPSTTIPTDIIRYLEAIISVTSILPHPPRKSMVCFLHDEIFQFLIQVAMLPLPFMTIVLSP